jgi:hypothetical protein
MEFFKFRIRPDWLGGPPSLHLNQHKFSLPGVKQARHDEHLNSSSAQVEKWMYFTSVPL